MSALSLLRGHGVEVVDHADTVLAKSTTMWKRCQRSQRLGRHDVGVVNDYIDKTMWTLSENFEPFSQILKEQSGVKRYLGVFTNSNNLKI